MVISRYGTNNFTQDIRRANKNDWWLTIVFIALARNECMARWPVFLAMPVDEWQQQQHKTVKNR